MRKIFLALILMSGIVSAQNFNDALRLSESGISFNAKALGMGNTVLTRFIGASSTQFNPAAIAFAKKSQIDLGLDYDLNGSSTTLFNTKLDTDQSVTNFNEIGVVLPVPTSRGSLALAVGYNQIKNFNRIVGFDGFNSANNSLIQDLTDYNEDLAYNLALSFPKYDKANKYLYDSTVVRGNLNQNGKIASDGDMHALYFAGAVEIEKDIFVGATFNFINGKFNRARVFTEEDSKNVYKGNLLLDPFEPKSGDFQSFTMRDKINWDLEAWDLKLGMIAKINDQLNAGLTIRIPRTTTVKEVYSVSGSSRFGSGGAWEDNYEDVKEQYNVKSPAEFSAGFSFSERNISFAGEAKLIDYSAMEFTQGFDPKSRQAKNDKIKDMMRSVVNINIGGEYVMDNITFRGGAIYLPSAFKDDPSEYNKKYLTAGVGYNISKTLQINAGFAYGWWEDFGDNYGTNVSRTYQKITSSNFLTSIKYNF